MLDRERRRWADTATGLGLTGQTAAAGTTVTELAAGWGTGQSAVRRRRPRWRRPGPAGSTAARPRLMGLRHRFRANRARSFSILARFSGLAAVSLTRWVSSRPFELRANSASFWGSDGTTSSVRYLAGMSRVSSDCLQFHLLGAVGTVVGLVHIRRDTSRSEQPVLVARKGICRLCERVSRTQLGLSRGSRSDSLAG